MLSTSMPAVSVYSDATACDMILDEVLFLLCGFLLNA
jgi:hypothetical protein